MCAHYGAQSATSLRQHPYHRIGGTISQRFSWNCKLRVLADRGSLPDHCRPLAQPPDCIEQSAPHTIVGTLRWVIPGLRRDFDEPLYVPTIVSQLKPLARYARKDPMHPASRLASVDCRWSATGVFGPDTSAYKCWCNIRAMLKTCITQLLHIFPKQGGARIRLQQVVNHAPR